MQDPPGRAFQEIRGISRTVYQSRCPKSNIVVEDYVEASSDGLLGYIYCKLPRPFTDY